MKIKTLPAGAPNFGLALVYILALLFSALIGVALSLGLKIIVLGLVALCAAVVVIIMPVELTLLALVLLTFVIAGMVGYFTGFQQILQLAYALGASLFLVFIVSFVGNSKRADSPLPIEYFLAIFFVLLQLVISFKNEVVFIQWIVAGKNYFAFYSLLLIMVYTPIRKEYFDRLWRMMCLIALIQPPVALYQYFVVGGKRVDLRLGDAWDSVVGTFGGSEFSGGQSAAMSLFMVVTVIYAVAQWRKGLLRGGVLAVLILATIITILIAEVKAMLVLLPLSFLLLYRREFFRRIREVLLGSLIVAMIVGAMPIVYSTLHYERQGRHSISYTEFIDQILVSQTDITAENSATGYLGRTALIKYWYEHNPVSQFDRFLLGHGIGSAQASRLSFGDAAKANYPYRLHTTSLSLLLWESGVLGAFLFSSILFIGALTSNRLSQDDRIPPVNRAYLEAGSVALILLLVTLPYKAYAFMTPSVNLLWVMLLAQNGYWYSKLYESK